MTSLLWIERGRFVARLAQTSADLDRALALRAQVFRTRRGLAGDDADHFDTLCQHVLVEDASGLLVCCYRLLAVSGADLIHHSYAARFYDLTRLAAFPGPMLELGRFCLHPDHHDPDILRLAWGALARLVDDGAAALLFGCASFDKADPAAHRPALALLRSAHLAPKEWRPQARPDGGHQVYPYASAVSDVPDPRAGLRAMPPLLRTYLAMGGWVSDHAVIDPDLDTLHVFTGVEIARIPAARARALRAIAL